MYRVLASLAPACNDHFTTLLLPAAITIDPARELLVLPHYDGEDLAARWDESDGGALLGPGLAAAVPAVLEDLARISTATVLTDLALSAIPSLVFDHDAALTRWQALPASSPALACSPATTAPRPGGCWPTSSTRP